MGETFGLHLMLDGYGCDPERLESEDFVYRFLNEFPGDIGMTKVMSPYVSRCEATDGTRCGLSGFVLIAESHVSVHTFPSSGCVSIDIFSCKSFDTSAAESEIVRRFRIKQVERTILDRGVEYPRNSLIAQHLLSAERDLCKLRAVGT